MALVGAVFCPRKSIRLTPPKRLAAITNLTEPVFPSKPPAKKSSGAAFCHVIRSEFERRIAESCPERLANGWNIQLTGGPAPHCEFHVFAPLIAELRDLLGQVTISAQYEGQLAAGVQAADDSRVPGTIRRACGHKLIAAANKWIGLLTGGFVFARRGEERLMLTRECPAARL